jgi:site-specific DNA-adenine methylase
MWSYYGSKLRLSKKYPHPKYDTLIEPFAGAAQYSLLHFEKDVILVDKYDVVIKVWKWLQKCSPKDILSLPKIEAGTKVSDFVWDCDEAKWLVGFIIAAGVATPRNTPSPWRTTLRPTSQEYKKKEIANSLHKIRHWKFIHGDYQCLYNTEATWFIDPPYQTGGTQYKHSTIDYAGLSDWSKSRKGQVIVCENDKADWMNFTYLSDLHGVKHHTKEVVYLQG